LVRTGKCRGADIKKFLGNPSWRRECPRRGESPLFEAARPSLEIRTTES